MSDWVQIPLEGVSCQVQPPLVRRELTAFIDKTGNSQSPPNPEEVSTTYVGLSSHATSSRQRSSGQSAQSAPHPLELTSASSSGDSTFWVLRDPQSCSYETAQIIQDGSLLDCSSAWFERAKCMLQDQRGDRAGSLSFSHQCQPSSRLAPKSQSLALDSVTVWIWNVLKG